MHQTLGIAVTFPAPEPLSKHERLTREMADDLMRYDAWHNDADAMQCLMDISRSCRPKYTTFDVWANVEKAVDEVKQRLIAKEMSDQ